MRPSLRVLLAYLVIILAAASFWLWQDFNAAIYSSNVELQTESQRPKLKSTDSLLKHSYRISFVGVSADAAVRIAWPSDVDLLAGAVRNISKIFGPGVSFDVESAVVNAASIGDESLFTFDKSASCHRLRIADAHRALKPRHWLLESGVLQLVVLIPPASHRPLCVGEGLLLESKWGVISVLNAAAVSNESTAGTSTVLIDAASVERLTNQLPALLGIQRSQFSKRQLWVDTVQSHLYCATRDLCAAAHTANAKDVTASGAQVQSLMQQARTALELSQRGSVSENVLSDESLLEAMRLSREAAAAAERVLLDPELVAELYFAPEHVQAIYLPFLLPAAVPLLVAAAKEFKQWRLARRSRTAAAATH